MYFPRDECGRNRKLSRPWHGPYRVVETKDPDIVVSKAYFPQEKTIQIHQTRVQPCPSNFLLAIIGMALREQVLDVLQDGWTDC